MLPHTALTRADLLALIRPGRVTRAGNRRLRIYGRLDCRSGRRMPAANRAFFADEAEAPALGFRPGGACLAERRRAWRDRR